MAELICIPAENVLSSISVIFGGTGDLTHRKLMPAFYNLVHDNLLPEHFAIVAVGRRPITLEQYRDDVHASLLLYSRNQIDESYWDELRQRIFLLSDGFCQT